MNLKRPGTAKEASRLADIEYELSSPYWPNFLVAYNEDRTKGSALGLAIKVYRNEIRPNSGSANQQLLDDLERFVDDLEYLNGSEVMAISQTIWYGPPIGGDEAALCVKRGISKLYSALGYYVCLELKNYEREVCATIILLEAASIHRNATYLHLKEVFLKS